MQSFKLVSHGRREISEQVGFYTLLVLIILSSSACENHTRLKSGDSVMESSTQFAPNTQVAPQPVTQPHKSRRISDITGENDLVKLSSKWWGQSLDQFPSFVGLTSADYAVTDSPGSRGDKVILPNPEISAAKWSPSELKVFNFTFAASSGLRLSEIVGFNPKGLTQLDFVKVLTSKYGSPKRVISAVGFTTYVWDLDESILDVGFMSFRISPAPYR